MGTRGALGFRLNGQDHLTYNQFDSYPDCMGHNTLEFIVKRYRALDYDGMIAGLKEDVSNLVAVNEDEKPTEAQKAMLKAQGCLDLGVSKQSEDDWYCLLRNTQGNLEKILAARFYSPANDFVMDSLFCEYAYIINLDEEVLEFYKGFQTLTGRRKAGRYWKATDKLKPYTEPMTRHDGSTWDREVGYGPVTLKKTIPLSEITEAGIKRFVDIMNGKKVKAS